MFRSYTPPLLHGPDRPWLGLCAHALTGQTPSSIPHGQVVTRDTALAAQSLTTALQRTSMRRCGGPKLRWPQTPTTLPLTANAQRPTVGASRGWTARRSRGPRCSCPRRTTARWVPPLPFGLGFSPLLITNHCHEGKKRTRAQVEARAQARDQTRAQVSRRSQPSGSCHPQTRAGAPASLAQPLHAPAPPSRLAPQTPSSRP